MSILTLPTLSRTCASSAIFSLVPNTLAAESPLNKTIQTSELPGARWKSSFSYNNLTDADARIFKAWINKLSGRAGRFYLYDFSHQTPSGTASGSPLVKGAGQQGRTLLTDGWAASQPKLLMPGDYFGIGQQLFVITEQISSDGNGNATLIFEAPIRSTFPDNSAITINKPTCVMALATDEQDKFLFEERNKTSISIDCLEMF